MEITNQDWKLFRSRLPDWQEAYMDRLNQEYAEILAKEGNPSDRFWALEKRIRQDKRSPGVQLRLSRSNMFNALIGLLTDGAITPDHLDGFSDSLREALGLFMERNMEDDIGETI